MASLINGSKVIHNSICINVSGVWKSFNANHVLNGVDFSVLEGESIALLGHNGAGKTTLLRIILGLLDIDQGSVTVQGKNPLNVGESIRKISGVLLEDTGLYESLTVYDNLKFFAEVYGCKKDFYEQRINELLGLFGILNKKNDVIKHFSMGMKKKVAIIRTILHNPEIVFLDEPINSLDPVSIEILHKIMKEMQTANKTTFVITTHNLDEVMKVCDKAVILKKGKCIVEKIAEFDSYLRTYFELIDVKNNDIIKKLMNRFHFEYNISDNFLIINQTDKDVIAEIIKELVYNNILFCGVSRKTVDLNKLYMEVEA